ncbi:MAG TPA: DNA polymerase III subunit epsilon [Gammaproteobacteria bacterium]
MRQIVLDTETTGLEPEAGHRIIEIGCVELVNRRATKNTFQRYINPEREIDAAAVEVHGIDSDFLHDKPVFAEIADDFLGFVDGAELVIHNAEFDISFINHEFSRLEHLPDDIRTRCDYLDTLALARRMHPGQRNNLDALAKRYEVDISKRELHGALLDARILADVYLAMTGGQATLSLDGTEEHRDEAAAEFGDIDRRGLDLVVANASPVEEQAHREFLDRIRALAGTTLWDSPGLEAEPREGGKP